MLISVIVPVYNAEPYLTKCLDSILVQAHRELEIILINDGSKDSSGVICDEYAKKDQRITVIHQANGGPSSARNAGLDIAAGAYIAFVDSDDFIAPEMFSTMMAAMAREDADLAICGVKSVDKNGREVFWNSGQVKNGVMNNAQAFRAMFQAVWYRTTWNKLYTYSLWQNIRFPLGRFREDEFPVHYIFDKCRKVVALEDKFYTGVIHNDSRSHDYSEKHMVDAWDAAYDRYLFFKGKGRGFGYCRIQSAREMYWRLIEAFEKLDFAEHRKAIAPLYQKTLWLLVKYGDPRAVKLFLYRHNPVLAERLVGFIKPLISFFRRRGKNSGNGSKILTGGNG